jgi:hypothetical protein
MINSTTAFLTVSQRPSFDVASSVGVANGNKQTYNTIYNNVGGHFSDANDRFTCPVAGHYFFYATTIKDGSKASNVCRVYIMKNGSTGWVGSRHLRLSEGATYGTNGIIGITTYAIAGDYFETEIKDSASTGSHSSVEYTYFGGYLIGQ